MTEESLVLAESEYERLVEEIHELQARIAELTALRDDLVYHVCPALRAEYDEKIVSLERELLAANMYLREKQRIIEILQAQMNRQQEPSYEKAEEKAKEEFRDYEEDLKKKAEEAKKQREKWEKENQWSAHDREEKEAEESEKAGEDQGEKEDAREDGRSGEDSKSGEDGRSGEGGTRGETGSGAEGKNGEGREESAKTDGTEGDGRGGSEETGNKKKEGGSAKETRGQKLKRLYRKIVKRTHPDTHPNTTEHELELFNRATKAYQTGDLEEMERIWEELAGMEAPEDLFQDTAEGRKKLREMLEKLKMRMRMLSREIEHIKADFPYKIKSFLEDEEAVEECRLGLKSKIDAVREQDRQLAEFIEKLREELKKRKQP